jgi:hypothetical protein
MNPRNTIVSLLNGNLTDAKESAKRYSTWKLLTAAELMGFPIAQQVAVASYLKGVIDFKKYCSIMG